MKRVQNKPGIYNKLQCRKRSRDGVNEGVGIGREGERGERKEGEEKGKKRRRRRRRIRRRRKKSLIIREILKLFEQSLLLIICFYNLHSTDGEGHRFYWLTV